MEDSNMSCKILYLIAALLFAFLVWGKALSILGQDKQKINIVLSELSSKDEIVKYIKTCGNFSEMMPGLVRLQEIDPEHFALFWTKIKLGKANFLYHVMKAEFEKLTGEPLIYDDASVPENTA